MPITQIGASEISAPSAVRRTPSPRRNRAMNDIRRRTDIEIAATAALSKTIDMPASTIARPQSHGTAPSWVIDPWTPMARSMSPAVDSEIAVPPTLRTAPETELICARAFMAAFCSAPYWRMVSSAR